VPERLDLMIDKMLARKPEQRYQSCAELIRDLQGLGLANATLSFLLPEGAAPLKMPVPSAGRTPAVQRTVALTEPKRGTKPIAPNKPATAKPAAQPVAGEWYLSYKTKEGKAVKRKMTVAQVIQYIKEDHFDPRTQAARTLDGDYRLLASYKEFETALRGRINRKQADRKTAKFQAIYQQLEKEQKSLERWRWFRNLFHGFVGYILLIVWLVVIAAVLVGGYFLVRKVLWPYFEQWFSKFTQ